MNRKDFILRSFSLLSSCSAVLKAEARSGTGAAKGRKPMVLSTWPHGLQANARAWAILAGNGKALDAVEKGVMVSELNPEVPTVGFGSYPDREGRISLDASIMDENGNCGAVAFLEHIKTPVAVARLVMEKTPHVMLAGQGALHFALANGFRKENLHTDFTRSKWEEWKKRNVGEPVDVHNHDTISMLAIDGEGNISGACSTGGLAFKHHGRVGDSPIIGAGLFVDNEVGGAGGTGVGEVIMKTLGSYLIVEAMRQGTHPREACRKAVERAFEKIPNGKNFPVYYIAVNKMGEFGAYGTKRGFEYAVCCEDTGNVLENADGLF